MNTPDTFQNARKRCFDPIVDDRTRLLVLGSLPGAQSLALQQYYGNRQNRFWSLMSDVLDLDLVALDYPARLAALRSRQVGLWDVVAEAERHGSLDAHIRQRDDNDLPGLLLQHPHICTIAFNGATAARLGTRLLGEMASLYRIVALPSSSPAYTLPYAEKSSRWMVLRDSLLDEESFNYEAIGRFIFTACRFGGDLTDVVNWFADESTLARPDPGECQQHLERLYAAFWKHCGSGAGVKESYQRFIAYMEQKAA